VRQLHAAATQLQWVVDSFNLVFAALLLTSASLSDRFGRKSMLLAGLTGPLTAQPGDTGPGHSRHEPHNTREAAHIGTIPARDTGTRSDTDHPVLSDGRACAGSAARLAARGMYKGLVSEAN
jgi:hypothetical protein